MNIAKKLLAKGEPVLALDRLQQILETADEANVWQVHKWQIYELIGAAYHDLANAEGAAQAYWNAAKSDTILRMQRMHLSNYIFALHYLPQVTAENLYEAAKVYNSLYRDVEPLKHYARSSKKIHVAYIAPHFLDSSSARFYESLLTDYNRDKFYVTAWSLSERADDFTDKIKRNVDKYFDVEKISFEETAEQIRDSGADILFDLGGHSEGGVTLQVAAYKPARVQISGIGYFDTTGLDAMDYFLTDKYLARSNSIFTEKLLTIDGAFTLKPNQKMIDAKKNLIRKPHEGVVFGCLNNFMKVDCLYLSNLVAIMYFFRNIKMIFRDTTPLESRRRIFINKLEYYKIPLNRVDVRIGTEDFFNDYTEIDAIIDTAPYTGGFMTALALYMGVPVFSEMRYIHHSKIGACILRQAGLGKLIDGNWRRVINKNCDFEMLSKEINIDKLTDTKSFVRRVYRKFAEVMSNE